MKGEMARAMGFIKRFRAFRIHTLLDLLENIHSRCRHPGEEWPFFERLSLLVVDSPSSVVAAVLGGAQSQGHALMMSLSRKLKQMAVELRLAVLITNHTVAGEGGDSKPALGESWKSVPHTRLLLRRPDASSTKCTASLIKHSFQRVGEEASFSITGGGVQAVQEAEVNSDDSTQ
eukprot:TRINITY_DN4019_c0_g3_i2.p1 TRINITY_DN4019_c0_g3~~TRINITY_DN4019_c0_g3_i2.p1  ORF type:complete len:175 (+),score=28.89 TRINITY_DN4019_c0_g3_i2:248-772(+)